MNIKAYEAKKEEIEKEFAQSRKVFIRSDLTAEELSECLVKSTKDLLIYLVKKGEKPVVNFEGGKLNGLESRLGIIESKSTFRIRGLLEALKKGSEMCIFADPVANSCGVADFIENPEKIDYIAIKKLYKIEGLSYYFSSDLNAAGKKEKLEMLRKHFIFGEKDFKFDSLQKFEYDPYNNKGSFKKIKEEKTEEKSMKNLSVKTPMSKDLLQDTLLGRDTGVERLAVWLDTGVFASPCDELVNGVGNIKVNTFPTKGVKNRHNLKVFLDKAVKGKIQGVKEIGFYPLSKKVSLRGITQRAKEAKNEHQAVKALSRFVGRRLNAFELTPSFVVEDKKGVRSDEVKQKPQNKYKTASLASEEFMLFFFNCVNKYGKEGAIGRVRLRRADQKASEFNSLVKVPDFSRDILVDYYLEEGVNVFGMYLPEFTLSKHLALESRVLSGVYFTGESSSADREKFDESVSGHLDKKLKEAKEELKNALLAQKDF